MLKQFTPFWQQFIVAVTLSVFCYVCLGTHLSAESDLPKIDLGLGACH